MPPHNARTTYTCSCVVDGYLHVYDGACEDIDDRYGRHQAGRGFGANLKHEPSKCPPAPSLCRTLPLCAHCSVWRSVAIHEGRKTHVQACSAQFPAAVSPSLHSCSPHTRAQPTAQAGVGNAHLRDKQGRPGKYMKLENVQVHMHVHNFLIVFVNFYIASNLSIFSRNDLYFACFSMKY